MAVIAETDFGWLIDHQKSINDSVSGCVDVSASLPLNVQSNPEMFKIDWPFLMDSQVQAKIALLPTKNDHCDAQLCSKDKGIDARIMKTGLPENKRKRKSKKSLMSNEGLIQAEKYHSKIADCMKLYTQELIQLGFQMNYFHLKLPSTENLNNVLARKCIQTIQSPNLIEHCSEEDQVVNYKVSDITCKTVENIIESSTLFRNVESHALLVEAFGKKCIIPAKSQFLLSDLQQLHLLIKADLKFDVIVIDPPWENKSVKRKKMYSTISHYDLFKIPVQNLANPDCLILIWTTNKLCQINFVKEKLFPKWSVTWNVDWHWIKVTRQGQTIYNFDSAHKKPYENLIIGRFSKSGKICLPLKQDGVIVSVPCALHSYKPPLADILSPYISQESKCLELFARSLIPNWFSWGNEVLKWQFMDCFEVKTSI